MPAVERATKHTSDKRVYDCVAVIHDWIAGKPADLNSAAWAAARAAAEAAWAAAAAARAARAAAAAAWAAAAAEAAWAAAAAAAEAAWAAWAKDERETQRQDLITAFPPLILKD
jgi:hypothetical protein